MFEEYWSFSENEQDLLNMSRVSYQVQKGEMPTWPQSMFCDVLYPKVMQQLLSDDYSSGHLKNKLDALGRIVENTLSGAHLPSVDMIYFQRDFEVFKSFMCWSLGIDKMEIEKVTGYKAWPFPVKALYDRYMAAMMSLSFSTVYYIQQVGKVEYEMRLVSGLLRVCGGLYNKCMRQLDTENAQKALSCINYLSVWHEKNVQSCVAAGMLQSIKTYTSQPIWAQVSALKTATASVGGRMLDYVTGEASWKHYIANEFRLVLKTDLVHLKKWGHASYQSVVLADRDGAAAAACTVKAYVEVYERVNAVLQEWRGLVFQARQAIEVKLRLDRSYLHRLDELDQLLKEAIQETERMEDEWWGHAHQSTVFHQTEIREANALLRMLREPCVRELERVAWVQHTYCDFRSTEGALSYEMFARNRANEEEHFRVTTEDEEAYIAQVFTMTDIAVERFADAMRRVKKEVMLKVHSDTSSDKPGLKAVADLCTTRMNDLKDTVQTFTELWKKSAWYGSRLRGVGQEPLITGDEATGSGHLVTHPEQPKTLLSIAVFEELHGEFLKIMALKLPYAMEKTVSVKAIPVTQQPYMGSPGDRDGKWFWEKTKDQVRQVQQEREALLADRQRLEEMRARLQQQLSQADQDYDKEMQADLLVNLRYELREVPEGEVEGVFDAAWERALAIYKKSSPERIKSSFLSIVSSGGVFEAFQARGCTFFSSRGGGVSVPAMSSPMLV